LEEKKYSSLCVKAVPKNANVENENIEEMMKLI
jgi:hypothetical protein